MRAASETERERFASVCAEAQKKQRQCAGIGTYQEKTLHFVMKYFVCDVESCHEISIYPETPDDSGVRESRYIADLRCGCDIFEIQTGGLYPLREKVKYYLEQTGYNIIIVCPIAARKWISVIDPETDEVSPRRRSPKKQSERDILPELFWLLEYLNNRRLTVRVVALELEEYRVKSRRARRGRGGAVRHERIPTELIGIHDFSVPADYIHLLPEKLPEAFTAAEFGRLAKLAGKKLYAVIKVFCEVGLIKKNGKRGRAAEYMRRV